jgi:hypothetical protein
MLLSLKKIARRLRGDQGFTMINVMMVMAAVMGISAAAFAATGSDLRIGVFDRSSKQAYAAAEAGVADYLSKLAGDNAYWRLCASRPAVPTYIGQKLDEGVQDTRVWRGVPDSTGEYTIELLPANDAPTCDPNNANGTMLDGRTGAFQVRVTGRVRRGGRTEGKRSIVATFKRTSFLEFLYFTDYETSDPFIKSIQTFDKPTRPNPSRFPTQALPSLPEWAADKCDDYYRNGRDALRWRDQDGVDQGSDGNLFDDGSILWSGSWRDWSGSCGRIQFGDSDVVNGPLHTNDELYVCGTPEFGRDGRNDRIEITSPNAFINCSGAQNAPKPVVRGDLQTRASKLEPPPDNNALKNEVMPGYLFSGQTTIVLQSDQILVNGVPKPYPPNGVIYVESGNCGQVYRPLDPYSVPAGCGDAYVSGSYNKDLTIAARKDVVISNDIVRPGATQGDKPDVTLGLIANGFVRVEHRLTSGPNLTASYPGPNGGSSPSCSDSVNSWSPEDRTIDAAILALNHSFIVDHYYCGGRIGTLNVHGVIAQRFRGPVGTSGSSGNGYIKNYNYDDRLSLRQPPHFLDPVRAAWRLRRQTEQIPAR